MRGSIEQVMIKGKSFERQGNLIEARKLYCSILEAFPSNIRVKKALSKLDENCSSQEFVKHPPKEKINYLLSLLSRGNTQLVIKETEDLKRRFPKSYLPRSLSAAAYKILGNLDEAEKEFQLALELQPDNIDLHNNLGLILTSKGYLNQAIESYKKAIKIKPAHMDAYINMANALNDQNQTQKAILVLKQAISITPSNSSIHYNKAILEKSLGDNEAAISSYQEAIKIKPDFAIAYNNLGSIYREQKKYNDAIHMFRKVIAINPLSDQGFFNLGESYEILNNTQKAFECYSKALEINPNHSGSNLHKGNIYRDNGQLDCAIDTYVKLTEIDPSYAEPHYNKALIDLKMGKWKEGWKGFEYRWKLAELLSEPLVPVSPYWDFRSPGRLLCWAEQGVGDQLMFASCINELRLHCDELVVSCDERLISLFKRSFDKSICFVKQDPHISGDLYDFHIPIGSAYGFLRQSDKSFEDNRKAYLLANSHKREELRKRLASINPGKKIAGISWSSNALKDASKRSIQLADLVNNIPDSFSLVNLQYGDVSHEIMDVEKSTGRSIIQVNDIDNFNDLDDFSAIIQACDIVVSIDNSTVHFAGALGVECHLLLPFSHASDWRWGLNGTPESYSYDKMFLHWQDSSHNWNTCLHGLKKKLIRY